MLSWIIMRLTLLAQLAQFLPKAGLLLFFDGTFGLATCGLQVVSCLAWTIIGPIPIAYQVCNGKFIEDYSLLCEALKRVGIQAQRGDGRF
jgi:hypothetical protein